MYISPDVKQQIEAVLSAPVPDPTTPEFDQFVEHLQRAHPELVRRILSGGASAPHVTLPSEAFIGRLRRRRWLRTILIRCFYKSEWPGELVVDKRRIIGAALVLFAGVFLPAIYVFNRAAMGRFLPTGQAKPASLVPSTTQSGSMVTGQSSRRDLHPVDLHALQEPRQTPPPPSLLPANLASGRLLEVPPPPVYPVSRIPSVHGDALATVPGTRLQHDLINGRTSDVFAFVAPEERSPARIFAFSQPETPGGVPSNIAVRPDPHTVAVPFEEPRQQGDDASVSLNKVGQFLERSGQVISARFITGLALVAGLEPTPVLAISDNPRWCGIDTCPHVTWLGQATYVGGPRVQIKISAALVEGHRYPVQAMALGPDMIAGIPASISSRTPTVAAQMIAEALAAGRDYLRMLEERQVTISNEWFGVTQNTNPDFLAYLLSRIAGSILAPARQATVDVAEIAPQTELRLLVLTAQGR